MPIAIMKYFFRKIAFYPVVRKGDLIDSVLATLGDRYSDFSV